MEKMGMKPVIIVAIIVIFVSGVGLSLTVSAYTGKIPLTA